MFNSSCVLILASFCIIRFSNMLYSEQVTADSIKQQNATQFFKNHDEESILTFCAASDDRASLYLLCTQVIQAYGLDKNDIYTTTLLIKKILNAVRNGNHASGSLSWSKKYRDERTTLADQISIMIRDYCIDLQATPKYKSIINGLYFSIMGGTNGRLAHSWKYKGVQTKIVPVEGRVLTVKLEKTIIDIEASPDYLYGITRDGHLFRSKYTLEDFIYSVDNFKELRSLVIDSTNRRAYCISSKERFLVWNLVDMSIIENYDIRKFLGILAIDRFSVTPNGERVALLDSLRNVYELEFGSGILRKINGLSKCDEIFYTSDVSLLAYQSKESSLLSYDVSEQKVIATTIRHFDAIKSINTHSRRSLVFVYQNGMYATTPKFDNISAVNHFGAITMTELLTYSTKSDYVTVCDNAYGMLIYDPSKQSSSVQYSDEIIYDSVIVEIENQIHAITSSPDSISIWKLQ